MTDEELAAHQPTVAALLCAVHDRAIAETHAILTGLSVESLRAVAVLMAGQMPADVVLGSRDLPLDGDVAWTPAQIYAAHALYLAGNESRVKLGEILWQRSRGRVAS
jgi:hypothetical protein